MTEDEMDAILLERYYEQYGHPPPGCQHGQRTLCRHIDRDFVAWQCDECGLVLRDAFPPEMFFALLPPMDVYAAADASLQQTRLLLRRTPSTLSVLSRMIRR